MPPGKKAASKTPMADYDDGCRVTSISTSSPITTSRRSSSPLISRPANASASRHRSRPSTPNLEKTSKSVSLDPVALHPGIHERITPKGLHQVIRVPDGLLTSKLRLDLIELTGGPLAPFGRIKI